MYSDSLLSSSHSSRCRVGSASYSRATSRVSANSYRFQCVPFRKSKIKSFVRIMRSPCKLKYDEQLCALTYYSQLPNSAYNYVLLHFRTSYNQFPYFILVDRCSWLKQPANTTWGPGCFSSFAWSWQFVYQDHLVTRACYAHLAHNSANLFFPRGRRLWMNMM